MNRFNRMGQAPYTEFRILPGHPILASIAASTGWQAMFISPRRNPVCFGQCAGSFGEALRLTRIVPGERKIICCQANFKQPMIDTGRFKHNQRGLRCPHPTGERSQARLVVGKLFMPTL